MRLVIADDHRLVIDTLTVYLRNVIPNLEVIQATSLEETIEKVGHSGGVDLILLDLYMPGMNGLEGLTVAQSRCPGVPVVIISGLADNHEMADALKWGAAGFIPKDIPAAAMVKALELVLTGETYVPSKLATFYDFRHGGGDRNARSKWKSDNPLNKLTARELEVITLITKGYTNNQIARELGIKPVTAAFHLKRAYTKLGVTNRTQAAAEALRLGCRATGMS